MKKTISITLAIMFLLAIMPATFSTYEISDWYAVEDWELEVCSKWGGTDEAQRGSATSDIYLSQLTVALQAEKTAFPDNTTLYEVSYYIQPFSEDIQFAIKLANSQNDTDYDIVTVTTASISAGASGFTAFYSDEFFDLAKIGYGDSSSSGPENILTVPILNQTATYTGGPSGSGGSTGTSTGGGSAWTDW
ncbi:MAG: hypothetical protein Q7J54_05555 [Candidatus Woesearchaeota archaeon]|nr:hypothetical protein [Candidatus Woesearchaeota archaeon]